MTKQTARGLQPDNLLFASKSGLLTYVVGYVTYVVGYVTLTFKRFDCFIYN
jgi:hypothetical protein